MSLVGTALIYPPGGGASGGTIDAGECCFVFDVGAPQSGNVFNDWAALAAVLLTTAGEKTVLVLASATIPAGLSVIPDTWLVANNSVPVVLTCADGAELRGLQGLRGRITLTQAVPSSAPNLLTTGARLRLHDGAIIRSAAGAAQPMVAVSGGGTVFADLGEDAFLIAATAADPVVSVAAGTTFLPRIVGGGYTPNVFSGAGNVSPIAGSESLANPDATTQPLLTGVLSVQHVDPDDKQFQTHAAPGLLPPMEPDSSLWVRLLADGSLPDAFNQTGPGHYLAGVAPRTITLSNPLNTLNGVVNGQIIIPQGAFAALKSDKTGGAWRVFQYSSRRIIASGSNSQALPAGVAVFSGVNGVFAPASVLAFLAGQLQNRAGRVLRSVYRSVAPVVAGDVALVVRINLGAVTPLAVFPAAGAGVSTIVDVPIGTAVAPGVNWVSGDFVEIGVLSTAGAGAGAAGFTAETGFV